MTLDDFNNVSFTDDHIRVLASLSGITISDDEISEVANRFSSLISELDKLNELDLSDIQPVVIFPETGAV